MPAEIDWPLTLGLIGVIVGGLAFVVGAVAAIYSVLTFRIQMRQDRASVTSIPVSEEELAILRLVDQNGPLLRGHFTTGPHRGSAWRFRTSNRLILDEDRNRWFFLAMDSLKARDLLVRDDASAQLKLTQEGRSVVRRDTRQPLGSRSLVLWNAPRENEETFPLP